MKIFALLGIGTLALAVLLAAQEAPKPPSTSKATAPAKVATFMMFYGKAEEAMKFYVSLFEKSKVTEVERWGKGEPGGTEGKVKLAHFTLGGQQYMCSDSVEHPFTFTPSMSLFVTCKTEREVDDLFAKLSKDGEVLMPLEAYPFAKRFAWVNDRFGVSWQIYLPNE